MFRRTSSNSGEIGGEVHQLLTDDIYDAAGKFREATHWTAEEVDEHSSHAHTSEVQSFAAIFDRPLDWTAFGVWASMLLHRYGADVLRLKGLLNIEGVPTPVLINGVQHIVHPPSHLDAWPDADRRSRLIFIVRGLERARIERSLAVFNDLVNAPARPATAYARSASCGAVLVAPKRTARRRKAGTQSR